jgi:hypothetical protein
MRKIRSVSVVKMHKMAPKIVISGQIFKGKIFMLEAFSWKLKAFCRGAENRLEKNCLGFGETENAN